MKVQAVKGLPEKLICNIFWWLYKNERKFLNQNIGWVIDSINTKERNLNKEDLFNWLMKYNKHLKLF